MHSRRFCVMITKVTVTRYIACDELCDDWPNADDSVSVGLCGILCSSVKSDKFEHIF